VKELGAQKLGKLDIVCPGFAVDCLETLEEIAMQNSEFFAEAGGGELRYIPALNDSDAHAAMLARLVSRHVSGWPEAMPGHDPQAGLQVSRQRALAMGAGR
jgi:protoporphyrin/coproporphyrin ferrochelatase